MKPNKRVLHHGNNAGLLTTRNPLAWNRGSPIGMNSRPRDIEDTVVFDSLDDILGLADLGSLPAFRSYPAVGEIGAFGIPDPFKAVGGVAKGFTNMFDAPKMIALGAIGGGLLGLFIGYKLGSR